MNIDFSIFQLEHTELNLSILHELLVKMDNLFIPRISSRANLDKYALKLLRNGIVFCAINSNGEYIGFLAMYANDIIYKNAFISFIGVFPEYQGKGVSANLMNKAVEETIKNKMRTISLEVDSCNHRAISFYKKHGFCKKAINGKSTFMKKKLFNNSPYADLGKLGA